MEITDDIRATVAGLSDAELLAMAKVDCGTHPTPTLVAACQELYGRGIAVPPQRFAWHPDEINASETPRASLAGEPEYGGFWRRFGAMWLDALFLIPVVVVQQWLASQTRYGLMWMIAPNLGVWFVYHMYLVRRFSGTPGKVFLGLRICRLDGGPIGYQEAFLRHSIDGAFSNLMLIALSIAALHVPDAEYFSLTYMTRTKRLIAAAPAWYSTVSAVSQLWSWSEFIVMMTNKKRRALHDFLAETVVLHEKDATTPDTSPLPPSITVAVPPVSGA